MWGGQKGIKDEVHSRTGNKAHGVRRRKVSPRATKVWEKIEANSQHTRKGELEKDKSTWPFQNSQRSNNVNPWGFGGGAIRIKGMARGSYRCRGGEPGRKLKNENPTCQRSHLHIVWESVPLREAERKKGAFLKTGNRTGAHDQGRDSLLKKVEGKQVVAQG